MFGIHMDNITKSCKSLEGNILSILDRYGCTETNVSSIMGIRDAPPSDWWKSMNASILPFPRREIVAAICLEFNKSPWYDWRVVFMEELKALCTTGIGGMITIVLGSWLPSWVPKVYQLTPEEGEGIYCDKVTPGYSFPVEYYGAISN
jgi:hypothetical protein